MVRQITVINQIKEQPKIFIPSDKDFYSMIPDALPKGCEEKYWLCNDDDGLPFDTMFSSYKQRQEWTEKGMWAFVSWRWVNPLAVWIGKRKCLEVMAGCGWLSLALMARVVDVKATDDMSWHTHEINKEKWEHVTEVEKLDAIEAVKKYGKEVDFVIMSWPPYNENIGYRVLREMNRQNKNAKMIYIGERLGGCTADDEFFQHFEEIEDAGFNEAANKFQSWKWLHDSLILGKYVKKVEDKNIF